MTSPPPHWIALEPPGDAQARALWGWRALALTPRVARVDEALVLEVAASERLWGGRARIHELLFESNPEGAQVKRASGATSLIAIALLRLALRRSRPPSRVPQDLPLDVLTAAAEHVGTLARAGCRTWGDVRALPRGGVARRFGAELLDALDAAWGLRAERHVWLAPPQVFDENVELPELVTTAPQLIDAAQKLLTRLAAWLAARRRGVLAFELEWTLDLKRLDGAVLPPNERLEVRTAQPAQDLTHLRRLASEQLWRATLAAPANHLRLRSIDTAPWGGADRSLLPGVEVEEGGRLHEFIERVSARLGAGNVVVPVLREDHRPEKRQSWVPAKDAAFASRTTAGATAAATRAVIPSADAFLPAWLLNPPLRLPLAGDTPCHGGGPLRRLTRMQRVETAWWEGEGPALRDYFIAQSVEAGLVWIYRERPARLADAPQGKFHWYLHGLYG